MANKDNRVELEIIPAVISSTVPSAIRDGEAHFVLTKIWASVDLAHRGSLAKQGLVAIPDGSLSFSFPCGSDELSLGELKGLIEGILSLFSGSYSVFVHFGDKEDHPLSTCAREERDF